MLGIFEKLALLLSQAESDIKDFAIVGHGNNAASFNSDVNGKKDSSRMRILFAWELGGNYGHLSKMLGVARHLRHRGHLVLFAVKNAVRTGKFLRDQGFRTLPSPRMTVRMDSLRRPVSFADILAGAGFGNLGVLDELVRSWQEIFNSVRPDVVVAQFAPVAQFTARLSKVCCLALNTGFECPPDRAPFPSFFPNFTVKRDRLLARELEILCNINKVCSRQGQPFYSNLQELVKSEINLLATFPELDHYRHRRNGCYIGPLSMLDYGVTKCWAEQKRPRIFVYLRPFPGVERVLDVLAKSGTKIIAHIPDIDHRFAATFAGTSLHIDTTMIKLSGLLEGMDLSITHAGHGTISATLLAGVPQLMVPTTIEQWLMCRNMENLGIGIAIGRYGDGGEFRAALETLLSDSSYREKAQGVARKYAMFNQERVILRIGNTIERLPAWTTARNGD